MKTNDKTPVFILGSGINALGIIRSFAEIKIKPLLVNHYKDFAMFSRYTNWAICPDPNDTTQLTTYLTNRVKDFDKKPVLFATSDIYLDFIIQNVEELEKYFSLPIPEPKILQVLLVKETMYKIAELAHVPCPKTKVIESFEKFNNIHKEFNFPFIIKPSMDVGFSKVFNNKIAKIENNQELEEFISILDKSSIRNKIYVVQEFIDGDVEDLYTITSYADKNHEIMGYSIGHKIRQFPPETGTITSGKVVHVEEILQHARNFIKHARFTGISNIEFKKDKLDGIYKLMEINPRSGLWNLSVLKSGINLPVMAYKELIGEKIEEEFNHNSNLIWLITPIDFYYALFANKRRNYNKYALSFRSWYKSIKGKKLDASFSWKDPLPFCIGMMNKYK